MKYACHPPLVHNVTLPLLQRVSLICKNWLNDVIRNPDLLTVLFTVSMVLNSFEIYFVRGFVVIHHSCMYKGS